ncbi:SPRY domain-containing protein [Tissierella sp.]|uniref:SPRY domain-containing protein n=1 Tax=Tissierella sp. TaxID=41274 RepID=UPI003054A0DB
MSLVTWSSTDNGRNGIVLSNENMTVEIPNDATIIRATKGKISGKWYYETKYYNPPNSAIMWGCAGVCTKKAPLFSNSAGGRHYDWQYCRCYSGPNGYLHPTGIEYGDNFVSGDIVGIALDLDNGILEFFKNGVSQGIAFTDLKIMEGELFPYLGSMRAEHGFKATANFGITPFQYEIPEGYLPYDIENAAWFNHNKYLLKKDNKILTIESDALVETILQEPLTKLDFEELGFNGLDFLLDKDLSNMELLINPPAETVVSTINVRAIPMPQLIIPAGDIILKMLDKIYNFTIYSNKNSAGDIRIIFSIDEGANWLTYNLDTGEFEEIDITKIKEVKEKGIYPDIFNSIGTKWNEVILNSKIRFAYYLEIEYINDISEVNKLEIEMDIHGRWKKARHGQDYHYKYDNEHLYVSFFKDGSYKINYQG